MGCWHGARGCGPWSGPPRWSGWYEPADWYDEFEWPVPPRYPRRRGPAPTPDAGDLEARLGELRDELRRVEDELGRLRDRGSSPDQATPEATGRRA